MTRSEPVASRIPAGVCSIVPRPQRTKPPNSLANCRRQGRDKLYGTGRSLLDIELDRRLLVQRKENLIDLDIVVEDARSELHQALERLQAATAARNAEADKLAQLIRLHE